MMVVNMELLLNFEATSQEFALWTGNHPRFKSRSGFRVQIPFWPLADVVLGSPEFNFSATLPPIFVLPCFRVSSGTFLNLSLKEKLRHFYE